MATLKVLGEEMNIKAAKIPANTAAVMKIFALAYHRNLIVRTPVDKGVLRSNWRLSIGIQTSAIISAYSPGSKLGIGESANARGAIAQGKAALAGFKVPNNIYINNAVPYLPYVDQGTEFIVGSFFVDRGISAGEREAKREVNSIKF